MTHAHCPHCGSTNSDGWNWFKSDNEWCHECHDCENVFLTEARLVDPWDSGELGRDERYAKAVDA